MRDGALADQLGGSANGAGAPRLLLTAFGPFPGLPLNASTTIIDAVALNLMRRRPGIAVRNAVLATEWRAGPDEVQRQLKEFSPDIALHFGVASCVTGIRLELTAQNARGRLDDATGRKARRRTIASGLPGKLPTTFPVTAIRARLEGMGLPVELSEDAGDYLCNATLFRSLALARRHAPARLTGFVHLPSALTDPEPAPDLQGFSWTHAIAGSTAIAEACLDLLPARVRGPSGAPA